ncbi:MAG: serpin family protein [Bacteroidales bacterium]|nr:serpin family protein [Bacteroidales bacterium]
MKRLSIILAVAAALVACDKLGNGNDECKPLELSTKSAEFVQEGQRFAFEFIDRVDASAEGDYIISPLSMQFLLGMVLDGAQGETADEICDVLGYGKGEKADVDKFCLSMLEQLPNMDKKTKLALANALFSDKSFPILDSYKSNVAKYYKAEIQNLDFSNSSSALKTINGWASKKTNKMIPKVLDSVSPDRPVILMNALYFKGEWTNTFKKSSTSDETFTNEAGVQSTVKMMKESSKSYKYTENDVYQAVNMPYGNGAYSMTVFLPKKGHKVADVVDVLKKSDWNAVLKGMSSEALSLWFPRFETKYEVVLNDMLCAMGMPRAFSGSADFSALSSFPLYLYLVKQNAIIKVDEEGTEAAAVSVAVFEKNAAPGPEFSFHADHPFLYVITEASTGVILFAGKYSNK